jgi:predicted nucleic acid-binding protein
MKPTAVAIETFIDTNVLLYLLDQDAAKAAVAREIIATGGVISVQVLNEFIHVANRKHTLGWDGVEEYLSNFHRLLRVEPLTVDSQARATTIARIHRLSIYDANILAAAELAGCRIVYSEDMQHEQRIGPLTIRNPFAATA